MVGKVYFHFYQENFFFEFEENVEITVEGLDYNAVYISKYNQDD